MVDTIRLLITLDCNLSCDYCCNNLPRVQSKFKSLAFHKIDWDRYQNVCISGGEPFLVPGLLLRVMAAIPREKKQYLYTNGLVVSEEAITKIADLGRLNGLNIGLHSPGQADDFPAIVREFPDRFIRFHIDQDKWAEYYSQSKTLRQMLRRGATVKLYRMDDCLRENEDIVVLDA